MKFVTTLTLEQENVQNEISMTSFMNDSLMTVFKEFPVFLTVFILLYFFELPRKYHLTKLNEHVFPQSFVSLDVLSLLPLLLLLLLLLLLIDFEVNKLSTNVDFNNC